jgi:YggT family protein
MNDVILGLVSLAFNVIYVLVLAHVLFSWLILARMIRPYHPFVRWIDQVTNPLLAPFRRLVPPQRASGWDLSPILLIVALWVAQQLLTGILGG